MTGCLPDALRGVQGSEDPSLGLPFCDASMAAPTPTAVPASPVILESGGGPAHPAREALMALYNAIGGPGWTRNGNWGSDAPIGEWEGVTTNERGWVVELVLTGGGGGGGLKGPIPPELATLTNLQMLWLSPNELNGPIPPWLANLTDLQKLNLSKNQLTGPIPPELGRLSRLEALDLSENNLTGGPPPELGNLSNLKTLDVAGNLLAGTIPAEFANLSLEKVSFSGASVYASPYFFGCFPHGAFAGHNPGIEMRMGDYRTDRYLSREPASGLAYCHDDYPEPDLPAVPEPTGDTDTDRAVLVHLYNSTNGPNWPKNYNWLSEGPIHDWQGVRVNPQGRVIGLDLDQYEIIGQIAPELGELFYLKDLVLKSEQLTGPIPPELLSWVSSTS